MGVHCVNMEGVAHVHFMSCEKMAIETIFLGMKPQRRPSLRPSGAYFTLSVYDTLSYYVGKGVLARDSAKLAS